MPGVDRHVSRHAPRPSFLVSATVAVLAGLLLAGCGGREDSSPLAEPLFEVDPEQLGPAFVGEELGLTFKPPVEWMRLADAQRQAVLDALEQPEGEDVYSTEVVEIFFSTDTLSFLALSTVQLDGSSAARDEYATSFAETIGLDEERADDEKAIAARMDFSVNEVSIVQFRYVQSNRVTFTLLLTSGPGNLVQFDYSIPTDSYQQESVKLESSIGSIELLSD